MRQSIVPVILAAALLFECHALPMGKTDDATLEQDTFTSLLSDEATENGFVGAEMAAQVPRVIVVADPGLWRDLRALRSYNNNNGLSFFKRRADEDSSSSSQQLTEHKGAGQQDLNIPILRRDTMRCMVGRVYRPCWEV